MLVWRSVILEMLRVDWNPRTVHTDLPWYILDDTV